MKALLLLILSAQLAWGSAYQSLRDAYYQAAQSEEGMEVFQEEIDKWQQEDVLKSGYEAMYFFLKAKYSWNPYAKLSYFYDGKDLLEEAIESDQDNLELRFLRLAIQDNLPEILNYNQEIEADRTFLNQHIGACADQDLKQRIEEYLNAVTANLK